MENNFERGKQLLIEGMEALVNQYCLYIKLARGLQLLGLNDFLGVEDSKFAMSVDKASLMEMGLDTLMQGLRNAKNVDDIKSAIEENSQFWEMIKG